MRTGVLPATSSEFVGGQAQRRRITTLIEGGARLITVVGPGGIGKTRLAIETLRRDIGTGVSRVSFIDLDACPGVGPAAVAAGLRAVSDRSGGRPHVLLLDTCDRAVTALAPALAEVLDGDPALCVVATARESIGWLDENLVPVPPLESTEALRLLRIRMAFTGLAEEQADDATLARICRHLDHNPLYLRLAAARLRHRPAAAVLQEVSGDAYDRRLYWSDAARVGIEARHRDIGSAIAWSLQHCDAAEVILLQRLSVFAHTADDLGGADLDTIAEVCADRELPATSIGSVLDRLVERSLIAVCLDGSSARWSLAESVRVYARTQLHQRDPYEANLLAARHRRVRLRESAPGSVPAPHRPRRPARGGSAGPESPAIPAAGSWESLSCAEREVARLAADGWSNRAIADVRRSSVRTVDAQLAAVRQKLQIGSRAEIAGYVPGRTAEPARREIRERSGHRRHRLVPR